MLLLLAPERIILLLEKKINITKMRTPPMKDNDKDFNEN
jgi:hypothetical protein